MLTFFPTPREGELLYSVIARYHHASRNPSIEHTDKDLFGTKSRHASRLFASNLNHLHSQLHPKTVYDPISLIDKHTLFPLYRPFSTKERAQQVENVMLDSNNGKHIHNLFGINSQRMPPLRFLQYCPKCIEENIHDSKDENKKPSWYRSHQVAGVKVCHKHSVWLATSSVNISSVYGKNNYHLPDDKYAGKGEDATDHKFFEHYKYIADSSHQLMKKNYLSEGLSFLVERYIHLLRNQGYVTYNGYLRQTRIIENFENIYGNEFLTEMNSLVNNANGHSWLSDMLRKSPFRTSHPCQHLLFMNAFNINVDVFFSNTLLSSEHENPFGVAPWPCLNRVSDHYLRETIDKCKVRYMGGKYKGSFKCPDCGYTYSRQGADNKPEDKLQHSRVIDFGPVWRKYVYQKVTIDKVPLRQLARSLHTNHHTIIHQIRYHEENKADAKLRFTQDLITNKKNDFINALKESPGITRTELRQGKHKKLTRWLSKYSPEWLRDNLPPKVKPKKPQVNKDWNKIDHIIVNQASLTCQKLLQEVNNPIQITEAAIIREIGYANVIRKQLDKIPKTQNFLKNSCESTDQFRIRRLIIFAQKVAKEGVSVSRSKLMRGVGLTKKNLTDDVEKILETLIDFYSE